MEATLALCNAKPLYLAETYQEVEDFRRAKAGLEESDNEVLVDVDHDDSDEMEADEQVQSLSGAGAKSFASTGSD